MASTLKGLGLIQQDVLYSLPHHVYFYSIDAGWFFRSGIFLYCTAGHQGQYFPKLTKQLSGDIIKIIIQRRFVLPLIAMILGFIGYIVVQLNIKVNISEEVREHYELPADDLIRLSLEEIDVIDFARFGS